MTPFGLRKRLKNAVKSALGMDEPAPVASKPPPPPAPRPAPAAASPSPPRASTTPSEETTGGTMWVQAARMDEVLPGCAKVVTVFGKKYALFEVDGEFFATLNACPHAGGQLGEGDLDGHTITCPFHAFQYDVRTGQCLGGQADAVETIRVKVDGGLVLLEV